MAPEAASDVCRSACGSETRSDAGLAPAAAVGARTRDCAKLGTYLHFFLAQRDLGDEFQTRRLVGLGILQVLGLEDVFVLLAVMTWSACGAEDDGGVYRNRDAGGRASSLPSPGASRTTKINTCVLGRKD